MDETPEKMPYPFRGPAGLSNEATRALVNDIEDKRRFLAHLEEGPKACRFGRWSLAWEDEQQVVAVVGNGTHTVKVDTLPPLPRAWPRVLAAALEALEPDRWHEDALEVQP